MTTTGENWVTLDTSPQGGWSWTTPLGGTADLGQDAVAERFFGQAGSQRTV